MKSKIQKYKICGKCNNSFLRLWKRLKINGELLSLCQRCTIKEESLKKKEKQAKAKARKKALRERITEKKLDTIFSRLVRNIYPSYCHSSKVPITVETSHCAHLVGRNNRCLRWDLRNCYPTTPQENMYNQLHVIQLAKKLYEYYLIDIDTWESASKQNTCKLTEGDRREMYDVFKDALDRVFQLNLITDETKREEKLISLRNEIVEKTKKIM